MTQHEDDLWFVQLAQGQIRALSLDELDEAFQAGTIDENSLVRQDGSAEWSPLHVILGGADEPQPESVVTETAVVVTAAPELPPVSAPPPPVVAELPAVEEVDFARSKKKGVVIGGLVAVAVLGAVGFTFVRMGPGNFAAPANVANALPAAAAGGGVSNDPTAADAGPRFNDEQRKMLMELDKKREAEAAARRATRAKENVGPSKPIKIGDPIKKGGSKYDPLNGSL